MLTAKIGSNDINCYDGQYSKEELKTWASKDIIKCPVCGKSYEYCHGQINTPYFRHKDKAECDYLYSEPETEEHIKGKIALYEWIKQQDGVTNAILEAWLPETKQRPDIMFEYGGDKWVIEFQCSPIATEQIERHRLYEVAGIKDFWICGTEEYFKNYINKETGGVDLSTIKSRENLETIFKRQTLSYTSGVYYNPYLDKLYVNYYGLVKNTPLQYLTLNYSSYDEYVLSDIVFKGNFYQDLPKYQSYTELDSNNAVMFNDKISNYGENVLFKVLPVLKNRLYKISGLTKGWKLSIYDSTYHKALIFKYYHNFFIEIIGNQVVIDRSYVRVLSKDIDENTTLNQLCDILFDWTVSTIEKQTLIRQQDKIIKIQYECRRKEEEQRIKHNIEIIKKILNNDLPKLRKALSKHDIRIHKIKSSDLDLIKYSIIINDKQFNSPLRTTVCLHLYLWASPQIIDVNIIRQKVVNAIATTVNNEIEQYWIYKNKLYWL